jgi:hypothetical protein
VTKRPDLNELDVLGSAELALDKVCLAIDSWIPHNAGFGFLDLAPSILRSNWLWDYIS